MDDKTRDKLSEASVKFLNDLIHIADEENYDRDSFVKASADMFQTMATISTFRAFKAKMTTSMFEEKIIRHEITTRPLTEEEKSEYAERGYADYEIPEYIFSCEMPKDGQEILVATSWGVSQDLCMIDCDECNNLFELETRGDWDGVKAWADMPKYKGGGSDA